MGRLIGPKTWDRTCGIFLRFFVRAVTVQNARGCLCGNLAFKMHALYEKIPGMGG